MAKLKSKLLDGLSQSEIEHSLYNRYDDIDADYDEWVHSDEYINMVNDRLNEMKPIYSEIDVHHALIYATDCMSVHPEEVGKDVYGKLLYEKVFEYLNQYNGL
jgi:hypothetical protein